jgi:hypothetical protein
LQAWEIDERAHARVRMHAVNATLTIDPATLSSPSLPGVTVCKTRKAARGMPVSASTIKCRTDEPDWRRDPVQFVAVAKADAVLPAVGAALDGAPKWLTADVLLTAEVDEISSAKLADFLPVSDKTATKHINDALARLERAADIRCDAIDPERCAELRTVALDALSGDLPWFNGTSRKRAAMAERVRQERLRMIEEEADAVRAGDVSGAQSIAHRRKWLERLFAVDPQRPYTPEQRAVLGTHRAAHDRLARWWEDAGYRKAKPWDDGRYRIGTRQPADWDRFCKKLPRRWVRR